MDIGELLEGYPSRDPLPRGGASQVTEADYGVQSLPGVSLKPSLCCKKGEDFASTIRSLVLTLCSSLVRLPMDLELGEERVPLGARCEGRSEPPQSTFVSLISLIYEVE